MLRGASAMNLLQRLGRRANQAVPASDPCQRRASRDMQLRLNARAVPFDRADAQVYALRDLAIGVAEREQREDLELAAAEVARRGRVGLRGGRLVDRSARAVE